jgi:hypothetical protein
VRSAYLPYKTFRRVGKRSAPTNRVPGTCRRVGKRKRTHLPRARNLS